MRRIQSKGMRPELAVRSMIHRMGYRYGLHCKDLPGKPDIVLRSRKKVIEVRGCFWHMHAGCAESHVPRSRETYWGPKLARNVQRDRTNSKLLKRLGWSLLVIWECEISDEKRLLKKLKAFFNL